MRRQHALALAALAALLLSAMPAAAQDDPEIRKEIDAQYQKLSEAHEKEDRKAILGLKTADFHAIFPDGKVGDSKVMEQYSKQFLESNEPPYHIKNTIQSLAVSENKLIAVAEVLQEATRYRDLGGQRRRVDSDCRINRDAADRVNRVGEVHETRAVENCRAPEIAAIVAAAEGQ